MQFGQLKRREFITLIGGAAALWPVGARAQQRSMPVIGFLHTRSPEDSTAQLAAFRRGLAENGYTEGENVHVEYRWGRGKYDLMPALAAELVHLPASLLFAGSEASILAAKAATTSLPIIFVVGSDPVKLGIVGSFNAPSANVTGVHILTVSLEASVLGFCAS